MKNTLKFFGILFMSLVLVTSCEEKDDEPTKDGYRIKEILTQCMENSELFYKETFIYKGDKLVTRKMEDHHLEGLITKEKTTFAYLENKISAVTHFTERGSDEWKLHDKKEYILENGLVKLEIEEWPNGYKDTIKYEYNGKKNLTKIYNVFIYDKAILHYSGNKLMKIIYYRGNDLSKKSEYVYSDNKVSEIVDYSYYNRWSRWRQITNKYNNKGLLIETNRYVIGSNNSFKTTYKYEVGKGNSELFQKSGIALFRDNFLLQWTLR